MRLVGRCSWVLGLSAGAAWAVVSLIGCGVDQVAHLPGLADALPNRPGGAGYIAGATNTGGGGGAGGGGFGGSSTGGFGGTGGTVVVGPAESICDVAASGNVAGSVCATCVNKSVGLADPAGCMTEDTACTNDVLCTSAVTCVAGCKAGSSLDGCIVSCIDPSPVYQLFLACVYKVCGVDCGQATPLACNVTDGG